MNFAGSILDGELLLLYINLFYFVLIGGSIENWSNTLRAAIAQHIEDNSNRYKDFIEGNIEDYLLKMSRNGGWSGHCEIQVFSKIYSVSVNIHELEFYTWTKL